MYSHVGFKIVWDDIHCLHVFCSCVRASRIEWKFDALTYRKSIENLYSSHSFKIDDVVSRWRGFVEGENRILELNKHFLNIYDNISEDPSSNYQFSSGSNSSSGISICNSSLIVIKARESGSRRKGCSSNINGGKERVAVEVLKKWKGKKKTLINKFFFFLNLEDVLCENVYESEQVIKRTI